MADLIHSGALQHLDYIYIDFHVSIGKDHKSFRYSISIFHKSVPPIFLISCQTTFLLLIVRDSIAAMNQVMANMKVKLVRSTELNLMDDESYGAAHELKPLPQC